MISPAIKKAGAIDKQDFARRGRENKARELFEKIKGLTTVAGGGSPKMATGKTELTLAQLKDLLKELDF